MQRKSLKTRINGRLRSYVGKFDNGVRLGKFLYIQRTQGFSPPSDEPFMSTEEVARLKQEIAKAEFFVEFGSGCSTVYADTLKINTISVEMIAYAQSVDLFSTARQRRYGFTKASCPSHRSQEWLGQMVFRRFTLNLQSVGEWPLQNWSYSQHRPRWRSFTNHQRGPINGGQSQFQAR